MKFETITYYPTNRVGFDVFKKVKEDLPESIKKHLILTPTHDTQNYIKIEANNKNVIEYLDKVLEERILDHSCRKRYHIEIDENEISNYSYFKIFVDCLEYGRFVFADVKMPDCSKDGCFLGSKLLAPVKIKTSKAKKLDIATLNYPWSKEVVLLISSRMKTIFDEKSVTGLYYESAGLLHSASKIDYERSKGINHIKYREIKTTKDMREIIETPFIARIIKHIHHKAKEIFIDKEYCHEHSTIRSGTPVLDPSLDYKTENSDFLQIEAVEVKDKIYQYHTNEFIISRKVLEILLEYKANGLRDVGLTFRSSFRPVV